MTVDVYVDYKGRGWELVRERMKQGTDETLRQGKCVGVYGLLSCSLRKKRKNPALV